MFKKIKYQGINYPIYFGLDLVELLKESLSCVNGISNFVFIFDDKLPKIYSKTILKLLLKKSENVLSISVKVSESKKNRKTKELIEDKILSQSFGRDTLLIIMGGGVLGDVGGFVAATYMRGVPYINIPTTLLAMADSSVGGKTAINCKYGKNLIGAYWNPSAVLIHIPQLKSLPNKQYQNGLFEILRIFITSDKNYFFIFLKNVEKIISREEFLIYDLIAKAIALKCSIVSQDERDKNLRKVLNFGHTIAHALEKNSNYSLPHGYAVGYGIWVESKISVLMGHLKEFDYQKIVQILLTLGLNREFFKQYPAREMVKSTKIDKKTSFNLPHYVLIKNIGKVCQLNNVFVRAVPDKVVIEAIRRIRYENRH